MDGEKRKRGDVGGEVDGKRRRVSEDSEVKTEEEQEDDEVEEFFAILRRIRVAVEYFEKGNGRGGHRELTASTESSWRRGPCFERRDFEKVDDGVIKGPGEEGEGDTGLDLNADPESDPPTRAES